MREVVEIALFSERPQEVRRFYEDLLGGRPESEWPGGAIFASGGLKLLVHVRTPPEGAGPANEDHLAVLASDVDAACAALRARGHRVELEPRDYPWGRSAYLRDPDGRMVELTRPPA